MSRSMGRMIFIVFVWFFSLRYYLECLNLSGRTERMTIDIAFWVLTVLAAYELVGLGKKMVQLKGRQAVLRREAVSAIIADKRTHLGIAVIVYVLLIPLTGFYLTSFVAFCVFSLILEMRSPIKMIVPGVLLIAFIYGVFTSLLQISLPASYFFK